LRFSYYSRLTRAEQAIYRRSDEIAAVRLGPDQAPLKALTRALEQALATGRREETERAAVALSRAIAERLRVRDATVRVLEVRPRGADAELHGLYVAEEGARPIIRVWMRTAAHRRVVAFKTFLRTLLHELCHHLDYELFALPDSFHTQGFFKRESSLFRQLVAPGPKQLSLDV